MDRPPALAKTDTPDVKKPDATIAIAQLFVQNNGSIAVALAEPELGSVDVWVMEKEQNLDQTFNNWN
ncbi:hypothetical protein LguiB_031577 [Lonicera macranthoides]